MTPRCEVRMNSTRYCTSGDVSVGVLLDLRERVRGIELRLQQVAIGALQLADRVGAEAAPRQADGVDAEDPCRAAADRAPERQRVLGHHRIAADEAVRPTRQNWCTAEPALMFA